IRATYEDYRRSGRSNKWSQDRSIHAERSSALSELLQDVDHIDRARVLDLGCGRGDLLPELVAAGVDPGRVVGVGLLPDRLTAAREGGLRTAVASGTTLPFPDSSFDLVVAFTVLSSVTDTNIRDRIANEIGRVLRPGG